MISKPAGQVGAEELAVHRDDGVTAGPVGGPEDVSAAGDVHADPDAVPVAGDLARPGDEERRRCRRLEVGGDRRRVEGGRVGPGVAVPQDAEVQGQVESGEARQRRRVPEDRAGAGLVGDERVGHGEVAGHDAGNGVAARGGEGRDQEEGEQELAHGGPQGTTTGVGEYGAAEQVRDHVLLGCRRQRRHGPVEEEAVGSPAPGRARARRGGGHEPLQAGRGRGRGGSERGEADEPVEELVLGFGTTSSQRAALTEDALGRLGQAAGSDCEQVRGAARSRGAGEVGWLGRIEDPLRADEEEQVLLRPRGTPARSSDARKEHPRPLGRW